ncbi:uncharacterized protein [Heliangelus exortis]|uniref:uncharacterized protein isoform X1 n=1 Tax=Heliangelus exortis TaxID=472823 RepID=UPI003A93FB12
MAWAPLLLVVLAHTSGSLVQAALTQTPSVLSVKPGDTVTITCSGTTNSYGWYQQKVPGSAPVTVIYWNNKRPSDIPSRFSGSKSGSTGTLTITGVQAEDEAVYFCGSYDSSINAATVTQSNVEVIQKCPTISGESFESLLSLFDGGAGPHLGHVLVSLHYRWLCLVSWLLCPLEPHVCAHPLSVGERLTSGSPVSSLHCMSKFPFAPCWHPESCGCLSACQPQVSDVGLPYETTASAPVLVFLGSGEDR